MNTFDDYLAMIGITPDHEACVQQHHDELTQQTTLVFEEIKAWMVDREIRQFIQPHLLSQLLNDLIGGDYGDEFYQRIYTNGLQLARMGCREDQALLMISRIRMCWIDLAYMEEHADRALLSQSISLIMDLTQFVLSSVFHLIALLDRVKAKAEGELIRLQRTFQLISVEVSNDLIQAYQDHLNWKINVFSLALGNEIPAELVPTTPEQCRLTLWLNAGGWDRIEEKRRLVMESAQQHLHRVGERILDLASNHHPEAIVVYLGELEQASDMVCDVLLECIDIEVATYATMDTLTELPNRRAFQREQAVKLSLCQRHRWWLGVMMLDIDHFKKINDQHGHGVGDQVLVHLSSVLQQTLRLEDSIYRWGGEEFLILSLSPNHDRLGDLCERIRVAVESRAFVDAKTKLTVPVTISIGALFVNPSKINTLLDERIAQADSLLYKSKRNGRNRVSFEVLL